MGSDHGMGSILEVDVCEAHFRVKVTRRNVIGFSENYTSDWEAKSQFTLNQYRVAKQIRCQELSYRQYSAPLFFKVCA